MNEKILQGFLIAVIVLGSGYLVYSFLLISDDATLVEESTVEEGELNKTIVYDRGIEVYLFNAESKTSNVFTILGNNQSGINRTGLNLKETSVDPTGRYILFIHSHTDTLSIYDTKTQTRSDVAVADVVDRLKPQHIREINWSPDGSKYSYIVYRNRDDIARSFIRSINGELITAIDDGVSQPIVWKNDSAISFIQNETLYLGTTDNPKQQTVVTDARKEFKYNDYGNGRMIIPHWQGDYLVYESTQGFLYAYDSINGIKTELGALDLSKAYDTFPLGWLNKTTFLFSAQSDVNYGDIVLKKFSTVDKSVAVVGKGDELNFSSPFRVNVINNMNQVVRFVDDFDYDSGIGSIGLETLSLDEDSGKLTQQCEYLSESTKNDVFRIYRPKLVSTIDSGFALIEIKRYQTDDPQEIIGGAISKTVLEMINTTDCSLVTSIETEGY